MLYSEPPEVALLPVPGLPAAPRAGAGLPGPRDRRLSARKGYPLPVAAVFLVWDAIAIANRVWSYNPEHMTGVRLPLAIPLEEFLFFLVIPVCAVLTYSCVQAMLRRLRTGRRTQEPAGEVRS